jgi:hypothetical protein
MGKKSVNKRKSLQLLLTQGLSEEVSSILDCESSHLIGTSIVSILGDNFIVYIWLLLLGDIPPSPGDIPREFHRTLVTRSNANATG